MRRCSFSCTRIVPALIVLLLLTVCVVGVHLISSDSALIGSWQTANGLSLEITKEEMILQGIPFAYEEGRGGTFVLEAGPLGLVSGSYQLHDDVLLLTIDGSEETFYRR